MSELKLGMKIRHEYQNGDRKVCRINKRTGYCRVYIVDGDRRKMLKYRLTEVLEMHYPIYSKEELKWLSSK
jgi:hypothetical protein